MVKATGGIPVVKAVAVALLAAAAAVVCVFAVVALGLVTIATWSIQRNIACCFSLSQMPRSMSKASLQEHDLSVQASKKVPKL